MSRLKALIWRVALQHSRWVGVVGFLLALILCNLSSTANDIVWSLNPSLARSIDGQSDEIVRYSRRFKQAVLDPRSTLTVGTLPAYVKDLFLTMPPIGELMIDASSALMDFAHASWILTRSSLRVGYEVSRLLLWSLRFATPYLAPPFLFCVHEFAHLPFQAKLIIILTITLNTSIWLAWRRRYIERGVTALRNWHRKVADFCVLTGPYVIVILLLYLPTKHALSFSQFRAVFQMAIYGLAIIQSVMATGQLWYLKRLQTSADAPTRRTPHPATARPSLLSSSAYNDEGSSVYLASPTFTTMPSSSWFTTMVTPRGPPQISPRGDQHRTHVASAVHHFLSFWATAICLHGIFYIPERVVEYLIGAPLPIFNFWHLSQSYVVPLKRLLLTKSAFANDRFDVMMNTPAPSWLASWPQMLGSTLISCEEVSLLCLFLAAMMNEPKLAALGRKTCLWTLETAVASVTGIRVDLAPRRPTPRRSPFDSDERLQGASADGGFRGGPLGRVWNLTRDFLSRHSAEWKSVALVLRLEKVGDAILHLSPLFFLIAPAFLIRYVLLISALLVPMIYSLKALQSHSMGKMGYWLTYASAFMLYICLLDICAYSSPLAAWLAFSLRPKLVAVTLIQLVCTEPDTLGVWVVRQASRISVSALATARRSVHKPSPQALQTFPGSSSTTAGNRKRAASHVSPGTSLRDASDPLTQSSEIDDADGMYNLTHSRVSSIQETLQPSKSASLRSRMTADGRYQALASGDSLQVTERPKRIRTSKVAAPAGNLTSTPSASQSGGPKGPSKTSSSHVSGASATRPEKYLQDDLIGGARPEELFLSNRSVRRKSLASTVSEFKPRKSSRVNPDMRATRSDKDLTSQLESESSGMLLVDDLPRDDSGADEVQPEKSRPRAHSRKREAPAMVKQASEDGADRRSSVLRDSRRRLLDPRRVDATTRSITPADL